MDGDRRPPVDGGGQLDAMSDILGTGVHEARRPLALARGYVQMLGDGSLGSLTDGQRRAVDRIEEKLLEAQAQLAQLDVAARLGVGKADVHEVALTDAAREAVRRAQAKADLRRGSIELRDDGEVRARADRTLLARILDNLIDNALVYSDGPPRVAVQVGREEAPFVRVSDRGLGLTGSTADAAFTKWFRGNPSDGGRPGSGLGLYLSRQAAEQMGASLEVEHTRPGTGTTFRLSFTRG